MEVCRESYTLPRQTNRPFDYRRTKRENKLCNRTTTSWGQNVGVRHESDYSGMAKDPNQLFFRPGASSTSLQANGSDVWILGGYAVRCGHAAFAPACAPLSRFRRLRAASRAVPHRYRQRPPV